MSVLLDKLEALGADNDLLDDIVDEAADRLVTQANNGGMSAQLNFLTHTAGMTESQILDAVTALHGEEV